MNKILISHEFPNVFYGNGFAEQYTDFDYCLIHRYLDTPSYAEYMKNAIKKGRTVYLDNGVYELGEAFDWEDYVRVILELKPTYYILPDVFNTLVKNIESQTSFYKKYGKRIYEETKSLPMAITHGACTEDLLDSFSILDNFLPEEGMIAIPFGSAAFSNNDGASKGYYRPDNIGYEPLRQALNRKIYMKELCNRMSGNRKVHLLGCKNLSEFDLRLMDFDKSFIVSLDTSIPVAMTFENRFFHLDGYYHKPTFLIDKNFYFDFEENENKDNLLKGLKFNISYFRNKVNEWHDFNWDF